jgi:hypothetical protein
VVERYGVVLLVVLDVDPCWLGEVEGGHADCPAAVPVISHEPTASHVLHVWPASCITL